jgi:alkanesulfonate monooxygenase SsuD/methylene tetrahydromethanopterin reductase-like flavin-dependent oxidoreductase (luciferase family)
LGKIDPGLRSPEVGLDLDAVGADARLLEELGYDGVVIEETKQDPYIVMALAAQATTRLKLGTAIAMAFPRSPTITALSAWTLQKLSRGLAWDWAATVHRRPVDRWSVSGSATSLSLLLAPMRPSSPRACGMFEQDLPSMSPPPPTGLPGYHGLGELARQLSSLARAQEWEKMPGNISDAVLEKFALVGTHDEIGDKLRVRFAGIIRIVNSPSR